MASDSKGNLAAFLVTTGGAGGSYRRFDAAQGQWQTEKLIDALLAKLNAHLQVVNGVAYVRSTDSSNCVTVGNGTTCGTILSLYDVTGDTWEEVPLDPYCQLARVEQDALIVGCNGYDGANQVYRVRQTGVWHETSRVDFGEASNDPTNWSPPSVEDPNVRVTDQGNLVGLWKATEKGSSFQNGKLVGTNTNRLIGGRYDRQSDTWSYSVVDESLENWGMSTGGQSLVGHLVQLDGLDNVVVAWVLYNVIVGPQSSAGQIRSPKPISVHAARLANAATIWDASETIGDATAIQTLSFVDSSDDVSILWVDGFGAYYGGVAASAVSQVVFDASQKLWSAEQAIPASDGGAWQLSLASDGDVRLLGWALPTADGAIKSIEVAWQAGAGQPWSNATKLELDLGAPSSAPIVALHGCEGTAIWTQDAKLWASQVD